MKYRKIKQYLNIIKRDDIKYIAKTFFEDPNTMILFLDKIHKYIHKHISSNSQIQASLQIRVNDILFNKICYNNSCNIMGWSYVKNFNTDIICMH